MATNFLRHVAINDDVDAEFSYWKSQLVLSAWTAVAFAVAAGFLIAAWPPGVGDPELRAFARHIWTLLVECAFWLGFFLGLMWAGAKRFGSSLAGTLPWQPANVIGPRLAGARLLGQNAVAFLMAGMGIGITRQFALLADPGMMQFLNALSGVTLVCFLLAAVLAMAAISGRRRVPR